MTRIAIILLVLALLSVTTRLESVTDTMERSYPQPGPAPVCQK